jgi:hypothetical protein
VTGVQTCALPICEVWDALWVSHTISGSFGKLARSIYKFILLK